jgi:hypothetical protein
VHQFRVAGQEMKRAIILRDAYRWVNLLVARQRSWQDDARLARLFNEASQDIGLVGSVVSCCSDGLVSMNTRTPQSASIMSVRSEGSMSRLEVVDSMDCVTGVELEESTFVDVPSGEVAFSKALL